LIQPCYFFATWSRRINCSLIFFALIGNLVGFEELPDAKERNNNFFLKITDKPFTPTTRFFTSFSRFA